MGQMAANSFEDVLNSISDDTDKQSLSGLIEKYPTMKNGWLRQDDYSRKLDSFKEVEKKAGEWDNWAQENWDFEANTPKLEKYWREKATELETKIGTDMTFDDINKYLTEKKLVSSDDLTKTLTEKESEINNSLQGSAYFAAMVSELQGEHLQEFGKPLKVRELVSKLNEYGTNDLEAAYSKFVAEPRQALAAKAREKEIETIRAEERKKAEDEFATKQFNHGLPVDQTNDGLGPLQQRLQHVGDPEAAAKATLGDGVTARLAAEAYRKEKLGVSQA